MQRSPAEAYRKVEFDARVAGGSPRELVLVCFDRFDSAIGSALAAAEKSDNAAKSAALTQALAALTALQLGIDERQPIAAALQQLYGGARQAILDATLAFAPLRLHQARSDFGEVRRALQNC